MAGRKEQLKKILGEIPLTAEIYWLTRRSEQPTNTGFSLRNIRAELPNALAATARYRKSAPVGKKVFLFSSTHKWLEIDVFLGLALAGQGHDVNLGYYPFGEWNIQSNLFDIRRQSAYARSILRQVSPVMKAVNLFRPNPSVENPPKLIQEAVKEVTDYDYMYALQTEEVDETDDFYSFRYDRNLQAAKTLCAYLKKLKPDVVIVPNGTILELGIAYRVSRLLKIPVVTFEFSDQRQVMWLAQNDEIMQQNTNLLWKNANGRNLVKKELKQVESLMASRKNASLYGNFSRQWQKTPSEGASSIKGKIGLDDRPIILMATNVMGDSLTLGRQVFSKSMAQWINRTIQYFIQIPDIQLVIRIHPGEALVKHGSIHEMIKNSLPELPEHIHVIEPEADVNTYDLMDLASLGLVYTTTVGLEMALRGIPVVVSGKTHYRDRGFTYDPGSWVQYFKILNLLLGNIQSERLTAEQVDLAWKYAYLFFFEYSYPFPWHMAGRKADFKDFSMNSVLSTKGLKKYGKTFDLLTFTKALDSINKETL
jgi:hypothetical protein